MRSTLWRELFTRAASAEGGASKQLAPHQGHLFLKDHKSVAPLPALATRTIIRRSGALGDAADGRAADRTRPAFTLVDARHPIIPAVARIQVPLLYVKLAVVGDGVAEHRQNLLAQQNDSRLGKPLCGQSRIDLRAVQGLGRIDVAQTHDLRLVEQRELDLLRAAFERVV